MPLPRLPAASSRPAPTVARGPKQSRFEGDLRTSYLSLDNARYFVASLLRPGDALCKPILPGLWEPILVNAGDWVLVLRGFEREDGAAVVQEWRCEVLGRA